MVGDIVQSIGVVIVAIIIYFKPAWHIADPIVTILFTILVLFTTIPIFKDCIIILMEAPPKAMNVNEVFEDINDVSFFRNNSLG